MPELPEVETSRRGIEPWLVGQTILWSEVRNTQLRWPIDEKIIRLRNQRVLSVQRRAKYLLLELENGWIIIHLGMSGRLCILVQPQPAEKHDHVDLVISNGCIIRYTDPRRFGAWLWCNDIHTNNLLVHLGPEPLSNNFNSCWLYQKSRNKRISTKPWLMDNRLVVGVGNIYANESLFTAGILPSRAAGTLSEKEAKLLVESIKTILLRSIEQGSTTLRDFLQTDGKLGPFVKDLQVYGRYGQPCRVCGTIIQRTKHRQRSTFFCHICQH